MCEKPPEVTENYSQNTIYLKRYKFYILYSLLNPLQPLYYRIFKSNKVFKSYSTTLF